ncbi:hypothetical protein [Dickeya solani]|uniref:Uncharacterized protein n=1 Tax=Dickeya solani D s0432-1 TaxID=1231725 RepID=A0AAV3KA01_9GAMM|nr:hypothetical protein [Dickeya solani]ANE75374.1 hypothetical protein A4U42_08510 [Dickeya solani IPO 2222]AUC42786.1 hypothetical protein D083_2437 [Dickeya solani RNS 08.23.3.1.A]AUH09212.1 hypothetical protein BJD21_12525 [Dickeya solani D s0432-1]AUH13184.1 hypothetical protein BJJ98_12490 [Dickeya solani]AYQ49927.1 hypothetical protein CTB91_04205 [Dickeya solani]
MKVSELAVGGVLLMLPLCGLAIAPYPADGNREFTEAQRAEIRRIVTEYLLAHPDRIQAIGQTPAIDGCMPVHPAGGNGKPSSCANTLWVCPPQ